MPRDKPISYKTILKNKKLDDFYEKTKPDEPQRVLGAHKKRK